MVAASLGDEAKSVLDLTYTLTPQIQPLLCGVLIPLLASPAFAQNKTAPSHPRPAPQVTARFVGTDGARILILEYVHDGKSATFIGRLQSACMVPLNSKAGDSKRLDLTTIPKNTVMTLFYARHQASEVGMPENVIMALRFDSLNGADSSLPQGVVIPCFKGAGQDSR